MLKIIRKLWSAVYDLLFLIEGRPVKTLEEIHKDLDVIEYLCRPYAEMDESDEYPMFLKEGDDK